MFLWATHAECCWGSKCYPISLTVIPYCNKSFWVCTRMQFVTVSVCKNIYELMWTLFTLHFLWWHFWKCLYKYNKISWYILRYLNGPQDIKKLKKATRVPWQKQVSEGKTIVLNDYSTTLIFTARIIWLLANIRHFFNVLYRSTEYLIADGVLDTLCHNLISLKL